MATTRAKPSSIQEADALFHEGVSANRELRFAEAEPLLQAAYDYFKEEEAKLSTLLKASEEEQKKELVEDRLVYASGLRDSAFFLGLNFLAQKNYIAARRWLIEARLYASFQANNLEIAASASFYLAKTLSAILKTTLMPQEEEYEKRLLDLYKNAAQLFSSLVKEGKKEYQKDQLSASLQYIVLAEASPSAENRELMNQILEDFNLRSENAAELAEAYYQSGLMYYQNKQYKEAKDHLQKACDSFEHLGLALNLAFARQSLYLCKEALGKMDGLSVARRVVSEVETTLAATKEADYLPRELALLVSVKLRFGLRLVLAHEISATAYLQNYLSETAAFSTETLELLYVFISLAADLDNSLAARQVHQQLKWVTYKRILGTEADSLLLVPPANTTAKLLQTFSYASKDSLKACPLQTDEPTSTTAAPSTKARFSLAQGQKATPKQNPLPALLQALPEYR